MNYVLVDDILSDLVFYDDWSSRTLTAEQNSLLSEFRSKLEVEFDGQLANYVFMYYRKCVLDGSAETVFTAEARATMVEILQFWADDVAVKKEFRRLYRGNNQSSEGLGMEEQVGIWEDMATWVSWPGRWGKKSGIVWPKVPSTKWFGW